MITFKGLPAPVVCDFLSREASRDHYTATGERPVHSALLAAGIPICEHLTNLASLPTEGFRFSAVPVMMKGMGTFPVRSYAVL